MVLEGYNNMDPHPIHQMAHSSRHSSPSSGIFFQGDIGNSHLTTSFGNNSSNSVPGIARRNHLGLVQLGPTDISNNVGSSNASIGASSLVTDANSGLSGGGPQLQRSASINTESYMRLPASPLSFTSNNHNNNNISMDGSSMVQQQQQQSPSSQQIHHHNSSATSRLGQVGQIQMPFNSQRIPNPYIQDPGNMSHLQKKICLDNNIEQEDVIQQMIQRQNPNSQLQAALIHQQRQQMIQSMTPSQRAQLIQQQQQHHQEIQLRQQMLQVQQHGGGNGGNDGGAQPMSGVKRPHDSGVCSRRIMQYLYHQRQRPSDNSIVYWRKFVAEYFSPHAKKRLCLSMYDNAGRHSFGVFPQASVDAWKCDICGTKSGRGFEATFEVLPRLNEINFGSGVIDEYLFLSLPRESKSPSGMMLLEYNKAVQESVYEQLRVVREGQLRIIFTPDLKILSWEFCARRHEELVIRRVVAPQVNQLLQVCQKWQSTLCDSAPDGGASRKDVQAGSNMAVTAGRRLARSLDSQQLNDLGFAKRYVRCLQVAEVVNGMKDLMDLVKVNKAGPIECLKSYPQHANSAAKSQMQEREMMRGNQGQGQGQGQGSTLNKLMGLHPGLQQQQQQQHTQISNNEKPVIKSETFQGHVGNIISNTFMMQQQVGQLQRNNNEESSSYQGSQALQQQMIQQMLNDIKSEQQPQPSLSGQSAGGSVGFDTVGLPPPQPPSRSNSFNASSNIESCANNNTGSSQKPPPPPPNRQSNLHLTDEVVPDIPEDFTDSFFDNDLDDMDDYGWKE